VFEGIRSLQIPLSSETNLFDALYDTIDRLETVEGRKYIILIASGRDTFSKRTLDQILKKVKASKDIAIYAIGTGQALRVARDDGSALSYDQLRLQHRMGPSRQSNEKLCQDDRRQGLFPVVPRFVQGRVR
jgi:hypothetical protein